MADERGDGDMEGGTGDDGNLDGDEYCPLVLGG